MSRVGKKPVDVPDGVDVSVQGAAVTVKGAQGELTMAIPSLSRVGVEDGKVTVDRVDESRASRSTHGLVRSLIANMIEGVSKGFKRELEIEGVGFRAAVEGQKVVMNLGYSSPVEYEAPAGVTVAVENGTAVTVSGPDKQRVGDTAARLRSFFPAEPYKGKGVRYKGEHVRRKVGKTVA